jgi:Glyoxalase-like domain
VGYLFPMSIRWYAVVVDCRDFKAQSRWWAEALDWRVGFEADDEVVVVPPHALDETRDVPPLERSPGLVFVSVPEGKAVKNRLHIDVAPPPDGDQEAEVRRLEAMGATRVGVGQDPATATWVVMADPEGNEFCVLSARD